MVEFTEKEDRLKTLIARRPRGAGDGKDQSKSDDDSKSTRRMKPLNTPGLIPDHGKLMHLFFIREPDLNFRASASAKTFLGNFEVALPPLPAGRYQVYADITHETGFAETLTAPQTCPPRPQKYSDIGAATARQTRSCGMGVIRTAPPEGFPLPPDPDDSGT